MQKNDTKNISTNHNQNLGDMTFAKMINVAWTHIQKQGLSFLLLAVAVWYFQMQNDRLQVKIDACTNTRIEKYESDQKLLLETVNRNTLVVTKLTQYIGVDKDK